MSKQTPVLSAPKIHQPGATPKISNSPTVTGTGSLYWNVRDIVFGPNRSAQNTDSKPNRSK